MFNAEEFLNDIRTLLSMEYNFVDVISFYTGFILKYRGYIKSGYGLEISKNVYFQFYCPQYYLCIYFRNMGGRDSPFVFEFSISRFRGIVRSALSNYGGTNHRNIDVVAAFELLSDSQKLFYLKNLDIFKTQ